VHEFINKAVEKVRTSTLSELKKQLPITDPKHTKHFLEQVKAHYACNFCNESHYEGEVASEMEPVCYSEKGLEISKA
jgi:hypothetical protein